MNHRKHFSWLVALALLFLALGSGACTYDDSCESNEDCDQAAGEVCLAAGVCGVGADTCIHGEDRPCTPGTHSRGTTRGNFGECNKDASKNKKGRVEICVGGAWVASRTRFEEVRQAYAQIGFQGAPAIAGFDTSKATTIFGVLSEADINTIRLDIDGKDYILCGEDSENSDPYGQETDPLTNNPLDPEFISREICNGLNDDCDADPADPTSIAGSIDEDFVGQRVNVRNVSGAALQAELAKCLSGAADAEGNCLCTEPGAVGACARSGVQTCEVLDGSTTAQLSCSSVEVSPVASQYACNGVDDNCNGVVDEYVTLAPNDVQYAFTKIPNYDPVVDTMSTTSVEIENRVSYLFATEVTPDAAGMLPEIDWNVLRPGVNQLTELLASPKGTSTTPIQILGLSPHLESVKADEEDQTAEKEYALLFYLGQIEFNCTNGLDDDGDGLVDCEENTAGTGECSSECGEINQQCSNGQDDDSDSFIDCEDSECFEFCADGSVKEDCASPGDEDENGLHDCADPICCDTALCQQTHFCKLELCGNGMDDDGDGASDCDDTECCDMPICEYAVACRVETHCDAGLAETVDGDGDGLIGCNDPDCCTRNSQCMTGSITQGPIGVCVVEDCTGGNDTNLNGLTGCADPACAGHASCLQPTSALRDTCERTNCGAGDAAQIAACSVFDFCREQECRSNHCGTDADPTTQASARARCLNFNFCNEDCSDGLDNNNDGLLDCCDPRCANTAECAVVSGCTGTPGTPVCTNFESKYHSQCMPCEFGGSACDNPLCADHPMCVDANSDGQRDAQAVGCNMGLDNEAACSTATCSESVFCRDQRELCHNFTDDDGDGLVDCEDLTDCGYSAFCSQELKVQITSFTPDGSGGLDNTPLVDICLTCDDKAALSGGRDVDATLGLRKFNYKNRPEFFEIVPRAGGEFFVMYGRTRESANRVISSLFTTSVKSTDVAPKPAQPVRLVGAEIRNPIRAARLSSKGSEVQMILLEECTRADTCTECPDTSTGACQCPCEERAEGAPRMGQIRLFKGAISNSTSALDIYASKVEGTAGTSTIFSLREQIPLQNFPRLGLYPFDIATFPHETLSNTSRVWIAFVTGDASRGESLMTYAYDLSSAGGATDSFKEVVEGVPPNDRPVIYPMKRIQEGWVVNTEQIPGDDKDPDDVSSQQTYVFRDVQLTPMCIDQGTSAPLCEQVLLSFHESGAEQPSPHMVALNIVSRPNSRMGSTATPGMIPLGAVINESKTQTATYQAMSEGNAARVFVETREVEGFSLQVGGFLTGEEPIYEFIYDLDEVPLHIRVAKILDENGNDIGNFFIRTFPENTAMRLLNNSTLPDEIAKLPEEFRVDPNNIDVELQIDTRTEYHIHWSALTPIAGSGFVPFAKELSCDTEPSQSFSGYGLADSVSDATTPPGN